VPVFALSFTDLGALTASAGESSVLPGLSDVSLTPESAAAGNQQKGVRPLGDGSTVLVNDWTYLKSTNKTNTHKTKTKKTTKQTGTHTRHTHTRTPHRHTH
jgi:hypothetical protein